MVRFALAFARRLPATLAVLGAGVVLAFPVAAATQVVGYAVSNTESARTLYRIDFATGEATAIGPTGSSKVEGLALSPAGELFGINPATSQLLRCSTETGGCTVVGTLTGVAPSLAGNAGLGFASDGRLYAAMNAGLFRVDPTSGSASFVGNTGIAVGGLAGISPQANCPSGLYALGSNTDRGRLFCLNTANGSATLLATLAGMSPVDGGLDGFADGALLYGVADNGSSASQVFEVAADKLVPENIRRVTAGGVDVTGLESLAVMRVASIAPASTDPHAVPTVSAANLSVLALALIALAAALSARRRGRG